jgi:hypothetical protein
MYGNVAHYATTPRVRNGHLATTADRGHPRKHGRAAGIYRGEVLVIRGALADIYADTSRILDILKENDEDDDEAEEANS